MIGKRVESLRGYVVKNDTGSTTLSGKGWMLVGLSYERTGDQNDVERGKNGGRVPHSLRKVNTRRRTE